MIVGWGPYIETWQQLSTITPQQIKPQRDLQTAPVLYVADHGPHGQFAATLSSLSRTIAGYKPFYAAWWFGREDRNPSSFVGGQRHFAGVPDSYSLPYILVAPQSTQSAVLYVTQQAVKVDMGTACPVLTRVP